MQSVNKQLNKEDGKPLAAKKTTTAKEPQKRNNKQKRWECKIPGTQALPESVDRSIRTD
ncbi:MULTISPECIES: hypothetical protein [Bacillus]|uniref:hypothetical protein n=1 Tax=Bacillus TaxID=1386 RepID=UPI0014828D67|nr:MULTISPECIES: hypothetical protein [Bacillus]